MNKIRPMNDSRKVQKSESTLRIAAWISEMLSMNKSELTLDIKKLIVC